MPMRRPSSSLQDDLLRTPVEYDAPRRKDHLFLWTVFLLLLVGFSMACWIGSYLVFSRPELPVSYKILRKIKKIDPPARFKVNAAPAGEFLTAEKLFDRFNAMSTPALRNLNRDLERAYLRNYPVGGGLEPYVTGRFTIMDSYQLRPTDFAPSGVVALAVSTDFPKLMIEQLYTSSPADAPLIKRNLQAGMDIELRRTFELTAVLHVTKLPDGHMQLTVVPINYGRYVFTGTNGGFELQPPPELNVASGWPVVKQERREAASQAYVDFRTRSGAGPLLTERKKDEKPKQTALKGVDSPVVDDTPTPTPGLVASAPTPAAVAAVAAAKGTVAGARKPSPTPLALASPTPLLAQAKIPVLPAIPVGEPSIPTPRPVATPRPVVKAAGTGGLNGGVSLQPFLAAPASAPDVPAMAAATGKPAATRAWATYAPGRMPAGKNVRVNEIAALSRGGGLSGEPVYLTGQFVVKAIGENKAKGIKNAVMRSGTDSNVRVIVEYPADRALPVEGSEINRDDQRPYQITDVRQVADGTINVFAREISE